jgi:hypothetical protein
MTLQIRRGLEEDRLSITPQAGEPIFVTDTRRLYIGDGSTNGGVLVGDELTNNYLTAYFSSNSYVQSLIVGMGDVTNSYMQSYVSTELANLVDSAPATLDTLNELAAALNDDSNFSTTVTTQIGLRATNTYVNSTFSSNSYLQTQLSAVDAVTLDGVDSTGFVSNNHFGDLRLTTNVGDVTNNYLTAVFSSNNYISDIVDTKATNTYVNSTFTSNNYVDGRFTSNNYIGATFSSNGYVQSYVSSEISSVVGSAPAGLNTLGELSSAIGDDPSFSSNVTNRFGLRATNTYVNSTFSSNAYLQAQLLAFEEGEVSNNYLQPILDFKATNTFVIGTFSSNSYLQAQLNLFEQGEVSNNYLQPLIDSKASNTHVNNIVAIRATNTYVNDTFTSNTYVQNRFASTTYVNFTFASNNYNKDVYSSNSYVTDLFATNNYIEGRFSSNSYLTNTFTTNNYITTSFARKDQNETFSSNVTIEDTLIIGSGNNVFTNVVDTQSYNNVTEKFELEGVSTASNTSAVIDTYSHGSEKVSLEYLVHLERGNGDETQVSKILATYNGVSNVTFSEYGQIFTSSQVLGDLSVVYNGANVELILEPLVLSSLRSKVVKTVIV